MKPNFKLDCIDHVAIRVRNLEESSKWYNKVLGLKRMQLEKWGDFPIFLMSERFGIALFPAEITAVSLESDSKSVKIDHFAFGVGNSSFDAAKIHLKNINIPFIEKDHFYYQSIYIKDLDGHTVELTTLKVDWEYIERESLIG